MFVFGFVGMVMSGQSAHAVEEPSWSLVYADGPFAIRDYTTTVVAETRVAGKRGAAINQGFRRLARYIFGANAGSQEIAMTAPVAQSAAGERIAMTAPVAQTASGGDWVVTFYMPPGSSLEAMPRPLDRDIVLRAEQARRVAVLRFSGLATRDNLDRHAAELRRRISARGDIAADELSYAFYDPPWTLPWARRNEVMIALQHERS